MTTNTVAAVLKGADADAAADALLANVPVTKLPMTAAAKRATSPVKISKATKATTKAMKAKPADATPKAKVTVAKPTPTKGTFTSVQLAAERKLDAKTLRARIRRNIEKWEPLFAGERHVFKDNAATRKAIDALLADA